MHRYLLRYHALLVTYRCSVCPSISSELFVMVTAIKRKTEEDVVPHVHPVPAVVAIT